MYTYVYILNSWVSAGGLTDPKGNMENMID